MNTVLWILQLVLAAIFTAHGWMLIAPPPELLEIINEDLGVTFRIFLGTAEILGAIGIVLPALTRIIPGLTVLAAASISFVGLSATVLHLYRAEYWQTVLTLVLCLMAGFVAYGRWRLCPIAMREQSSPDMEVSSEI